MTDALDAVAALVDSAVAASTIPGLLLAIVEGGRVSGVVARGTTEVGGGVPVTTSTRFRIASMTKSFAAATTLALRDEGLVALDDPIAQHVPLLTSVRGPTEDSPPLTIRHLLTMSAGLATDDAWADRHLGDGADEMDALFAAGATFAVAPGVRMDYSNYGYAMLGRVIESVVGRPCTEVISERILDPLGLTATTWDLSGLDPTTTEIAAPHRVVDAAAVHEGFEPLPNGGFAPMGGLWSTAADLALWIDFLCDAFPPRDGDDRFGTVLSRASRRELQQVHRAFSDLPVAHAPDGRLRQVGIGYCMGLNRFHHVDLGPVVTHSGGLPGYGSNMRWIPESGIGVVALGNVTYAPMYRLTHAALEALFDAGALTVTKPGHDESFVRPAAEALTSLLSDWNDEAAVSLFADNVVLDEPMERRRSAAAELVERHGTFTLEALEPLSRTEADLLLRGERGTVKVEMQLTPTVPPLIQWYEAIPEPEVEPEPEPEPEVDRN